MTTPAGQWMLKLTCFALVAVSVMACPMHLAAADLSGHWKGRWTTAPSAGHARQHSGSLRVRLRHQGGGHYRGVFAGRFAVVIPYIYRADVYQAGNSLVSTKRLGPLGEYTMQLSVPASGVMQGGWKAMGASGSIHLRRR